jgi:TonB family protein
VRDWGLLYERQPLHLDALLLMVALILHAPLMLVHVKAPPKAAKGKPFARLVNIDFIEEQIKKRKEKPIVLPPKMPEAPKQLQEMVKKMEEASQQVFKRSLPPPPAPTAPRIPDTLIRGPEAAKLLDKVLQDKLDQERKTLQSKGAFGGKDLKLGGPQGGPAGLKVGEGAALQAGSRLSGVAAAPAGGTLRGKSGFQVSKEAAPQGIGGGDEGGIKMGGPSQIVVMPVGSRGKADSSIMSPVAKKDRGALASAAPVGPAAPVSGSGLAGGAGIKPAAAPIAAAGRPAAPAALPAAVKEGKTFASPVANPLGAAATPSPGAPPVLPTRRIVAQTQRPLFLITGPLADRKIVNRVVPEYPEWARSKGIESAVVLQFTVGPDGAVKDNVLVVRTSGYPQLDEVAVHALLQWKFVPLAADQYRDEVGAITFNFSVR